MAGEKSKILIIGGTGYIGKFVVEASIQLGHPTFVLVRESTVSNPAKASIVEGFKNSGATIVYGDLNDHESLVKAIKQVDVVISTVGAAQMADQTKIIDAIKEAGNIKRFFPSEFGLDYDHAQTVGPAKPIFDTKVTIRRAVEASGIPYTFVASNYFAGYSLPTVVQVDAMAPPTDKIVVLGDGNTKGIFVDEKDIATYTIRAVDDPRTLNKTVYVNPSGNILSHNEIISLWEKKSGKTLERIYLSEEEVLKKVEESPFPFNVMTALFYTIFVRGDMTNFEIDPSVGAEATRLYPDVKYTSVGEYINRLF